MIPPTKCPHCGHALQEKQDRLVCVRNKHHYWSVLDGKWHDTSPWIRQPVEVVVPPFVRK